ncbi:MAG: hypothetical protein ABIA59_05660 [Candidatus Latescibacterota bacterium]
MPANQQSHEASGPAPTSLGFPATRGDLQDRKLWPQYAKAYEDALKQTSTEWAPWYIIPANRKWYRNLLVGSVIVKALRGMNMNYPEPEENLDDIVIE